MLPGIGVCLALFLCLFADNLQTPLYHHFVKIHVIHVKIQMSMCLICMYVVRIPLQCVYLYGQNASSGDLPIRTCCDTLFAIVLPRVVCKVVLQLLASFSLMLQCTDVHWASIAVGKTREPYTVLQ